MNLIKENIKVSIVVPNFNSERFIESTLNSILAQSYTNFEILVIDNGSNDNSIEIIRKKILNDNRIKLIELSRNSGGPARPRNIGIKKSKGEFIAFIDSDDQWHPQKLFIQMKVVEKNNVKFVSCLRKDFHSDKENSNIEKYDIQNLDCKEISFKTLLKKNTISTSGVLVDKKLLIDLCFSEKKKHIAIEDYFLWLQVHEYISSSLMVKLPLLFYRKTSGSLTPHKWKIFFQKILLFSEYTFIKKRPKFYKVKILLVYIKNSALNSWLKKDEN
tara:strand:+ start:242 stop:1060 length:819 start_codon:yes stop_codon:yes gene_type:complete